jgi:hypothetical protein
MIFDKPEKKIQIGLAIGVVFGVLATSGCGVKSDPQPTDVPTPIGTGQVVKKIQRPPEEKIQTIDLEKDIQDSAAAKKVEAEQDEKNKKRTKKN